MMVPSFSITHEFHLYRRYINYARTIFLSTCEFRKRFKRRRYVEWAGYACMRRRHRPFGMSRRFVFHIKWHAHARHIRFIERAVQNQTLALAHSSTLLVLYINNFLNGFFFYSLIVTFRMATVRTTKMKRTFAADI